MRTTDMNIDKKKLYLMAKITSITRQAIADEMKLTDLRYSGTLSEEGFLARLFDLKALPSNDSRYTNAYDDIAQHTSWNDWDEAWYLVDPRINVLYSPDELYIRFIELSVHPTARNNTYEIEKAVRLYNQHLEADGYALYKDSEISGRPIYKISVLSAGSSVAAAGKANIKKHLDTPYVNAKIKLMHESVKSDPGLAIGTAKELIETTCISILKQRGVTPDKDWTVSQLIKNTNKVLSFTPSEAEDAKKAEASISTILSGINQIITGVTELRNAYGTGHGKDANFKGLEPMYAQLAVDAVSAVSILYLNVNGTSAELIETKNDF